MCGCEYSFAHSYSAAVKLAVPLSVPIRDVVRGKRWKTTIADESAERHAMTVISGIDIPSGASHDSATFADAGVPTAMLFIRNANGSHNPDEAMEIANFIDVTKLLSAALSV
jgi:acetylornithine deacetylase/succinyl-diaminopimelate desuccinylase-like protein